MRLSVDYQTRYAYSAPAQRVIQLMRVTPQSFAGQTVLEWRVDVDCDARLQQGRDGYGNITHMLYVDEPLERLTVSVTGKMLTEDRTGVVHGLPNDLPPEVFLRPTALTSATGLLANCATAVKTHGGSPLEQLHLLNAEIHGRMTFDTAKTDASTTAGEAFDARHGVCQDFAHIFLAVARHVGIPARYVSGHLFRRDGSGVQEAAHAWAEGWVEGLGWIAFDPANGICADDAYIRVASGLDYRDAAPFAGARRGGGKESLSVGVEVKLARSQSQSQSQSQS